VIRPDRVANELVSAIFDFLTDKNLNSDASPSKFHPYSNGSELWADAMPKGKASIRTTA
jgi:hypothetical protein